MNAIKFTCLLFVIHNLSALGDFPIIALKDINLTNCHLVKIGTEEGATRAIYTNGDRFFKIWDDHFWRAPYFLQALKHGLYDNTNTPLVGLIYQNNKCCGYVTRAGKHQNRLSNNIALYPIDQQQDNAYLDFYSDLLDRIKRLHLVYLDLTPFNIVLEDDKIKIIDLEPVLPLNKVNDTFFNDQAYPADYRFYIRKLKSGRRALSMQEYAVIKQTTLHLCYTK